MSDYGAADGLSADAADFEDKGDVSERQPEGRCLFSARRVGKLPWDVEHEWDESEDRMVAAAMAWHREHSHLPRHELTGEKRMRELVEVMLREEAG